MAGIPKRLIFVTVAAMSAFVTQFVLHSSRAPQIHLSSQISLSPGLIAGVASVIDGDTIEIRGQRIRFNGIDAPEAGSFVTTRAAPTIRAAGDRPKR
ncbi:MULTISPECIES: hypothetical protein [unclassified Mesorhizobium]|uniref:thermonuclease family protein n=1 Tax=unclassified Mesorhizobium TaxID=325217 RepID=UPI00333C1D98